MVQSEVAVAAALVEVYTLMVGSRSEIASTWRWRMVADSGHLFSIDVDPPYP